MEIKIYNSLSNKIEVFKPIERNQLSMYVCGPTVYSDIHIGNARPLVFFDTVARFFKYLGYNVRLVSNFTDIDDQIVQKALLTNKSEQEIAQYYIEAFLQVSSLLNCEDLFASPRVTEYIDLIIDYIQVLIDKGFAYKSGHNVFFRVTKAQEYGVLSNQKIDELDIGARIVIDSLKEDPRDFVLWKKTEQGIQWDSPFGRGRPGWHTECVVMVEAVFGGMIDIHGGGNDLKFPHHENEIAQAMAVSNHMIANYWVHNGRIDLSDEKMSKSLGNVVWAKDVLEKYTGNIVRLMILNNHYRQNITYKEELLARSALEFDKIERTYLQVYRSLELNDAFEEVTTLPLMDEFLSEMANDFTTPNAITHLYQLIKEINISLRQNPSWYELNRMFITLQAMMYVLGLQVDITPLTVSDKSLINAWQGARELRDFQQADLLREEIAKRGIRLS